MVNCEYYDGTGKMDCYDCDGSGTYEDGEVCGMCSGEGVIECEYCGGTGEKDEN